jgi:hypothetical protein
VGRLACADDVGLESVLGGLRELHVDDRALLNAATAVSNAIYAAPAAATGTSA